MDALLAEMYQFYEPISIPPNKEERLELIVMLDVESNGCISLTDFVDNLENKCFKNALRDLRSKRELFHRFINVANVQNRLQNVIVRSESAVAEFLPSSSNPEEGNRTVTRTTSLSSRSEQTVRDASDYGRVGDSRLVELFRQQSVERFTSPRPSGVDEKQATPPPPTLFSWTCLRGALQYIAIKADSYIFDMAVDSIILVLAVIFFIYWSNSVFIAYLTMTALETLLKIWAKGSFRYLRSKRNSLDGALSVTILIFTIAIIGNHDAADEAVVFANSFTLRQSPHHRFILLITQSLA
jgi:hypothetical protein